ncbi:hypothetical protein L218DRAFT_945996 [Marasmius fiardii PR-910]|nr:hypothetical protein L218DRAFT_945996 [Marasmius fiardii PR-910]
MYSPGHASTPKAPKLRNIALPPASPSLPPPKNLYSTPTIIANLTVSTVSPPPNKQPASQTRPSSRMSQYTASGNTTSNTKRPLKSILKNSVWPPGVQTTSSQTSSTSSSSSQSRPLQGILKKPRIEKRPEDFPNATAHLSAQSSIPAIAPHEVRPSDVGPSGFDALSPATSTRTSGGLKPGQISLNWILIHQDRERKRPEQFRHLQKGFDMAFQPNHTSGVWVYDTRKQTYINPTQFIEQSASTHSTLRGASLHIVAAWNPRWECTVRPTSRGIQCIDVFLAIFDMLQTPLTGDEHRTANYAALERARSERVRRTPHATPASRDYLRVDLLGPNRHFKGLTQKGLDWHLETFGPTDSSHGAR